MNLQTIEKQVLRPDGEVSIHHFFRTIQGEGPYAGHPAIFIRMAGCNLQCPMCDTDYTSLGSRKSVGEFLTPEDVKDAVRTASLGYRIGLVVVSGGEPFRQNITPMISSLIYGGYHVQIETNGTLFVPDQPHDGMYPLSWKSQEDVTIVCSPKTGKIDPRISPFIDFYKYVLHSDDIDPDDGLPGHVLGHSAHPRVARPPPEIGSGEEYDNDSGRVYLQPADTPDEPGANQRHLDACIKSCMQYGYILSLQNHKAIGLE